jgi:hypothetical protein
MIGLHENPGVVPMDSRVRHPWLYDQNFVVAQEIGQVLSVDKVLLLAVEVLHETICNNTLPHCMKDGSSRADVLIVTTLLKVLSGLVRQDDASQQRKPTQFKRLSPHKCCTYLGHGPSFQHQQQGCPS